MFIRILAYAKKIRQKIHTKRDAARDLNIAEHARMTIILKYMRQRHAWRSVIYRFIYPQKYYNKFPNFSIHLSEAGWANMHVYRSHELTTLGIQCRTVKSSLYADHCLRVGGSPLYLMCPRASILGWLGT